MKNEGSRHEWRDERLGLKRVVRCAGELPDWLAWLGWTDDFRPIDDSAAAVLEWLEHAIARGRTLELWEVGEPLHDQDIALACLVSLVRNGWLLADRLRANGWRHLPHEPKDGELDIAGAIRALRQLRDNIADTLAAKTPQITTGTPTAADAPPGTGQSEGDGTGLPYRSPATYERDKWIYESIAKYTCHTLSRKLRGIVKTKKWILISSRNGFKKAADRYADFHDLEHRRFPGK